MPFVSVNDLRLYYELDGPASDETILFISGLGVDHRGWNNITPSLARHYRTITFDNRDVGLSQSCSKQYGIADMAKDTNDILEHLGLSKINIVGISMGGAIAQELSISFPQMVKRMVLLSTYTHGDLRGNALFRGFLKARRLLNREDYINLTMPWLYSHNDYQIPMLIDNLRRYRLEDQLYQEDEAYERQMEATINYSSRYMLDKIHCPTLLIFGGNDIITPARFATELEFGIKDSTLITLEGTGHGFLNTKPTEISTLIGNFIEQNAK